MKKKRKLSKSGQVTVFIILAILIVVGFIGYMIFKNTLFAQTVPKDLESVYIYYLACIEEEAKLGSIIMEEQAGYIEPPDFKPGSSYMPFSNQLDFLGIGVPYWYYISSNGIVKEQIPSNDFMQGQLNDFIEDQMDRCDFSSFVDEGFEIKIGNEIDVSTKIEKNKIIVNVNQDLSIRTSNVSWSGSNHLKDVDSNLGSFYDLSKKIYENFKETMFLESYGVDILRLYAPVDGVEIGCSPKIWALGDVRENLTQALEANIGFIKVEGDYYELNDEEDKYFVKDIGENVDANVNFLYLREWPMKMEVWPSEGELLRADPIGLQEGLGMLGFCYTPYHFVYDFAYPVLIQTYYEGEMFQFPVIVYINKNKPREPMDTESAPNPVPELCIHKNTEITVYTYNKNLMPVEAEIEFKCLDTNCDIGSTRLADGDAVLTANFPQCVNGYVIARADGYADTKEIISSVDETEVSIFMDRMYELDIEVSKFGRIVSGDDYAVITFTKGERTTTVSYPEQTRVKLTEGQYEVKAYIYSVADVNLQGGTTQSCVDVPKSGVFGVFGMTEERCFDINIPDQDVNFAVSGGGTQEHYISESELEYAGKIIIDADDFGVPSVVEDIQLNYNSIDSSLLDVRFE
jgi:hypothetical protein